MVHHTNIQFPLSVIFKACTPRHVKEAGRFIDGHPGPLLAEKLAQTCALYQAPHKLLQVPTAQLHEITTFPYFLFFNDPKGEKAVLVHGCDNGKLTVELDGNTNQLPLTETDPFRSSPHLLLFKPAGSDVNFTYGTITAPPATRPWLLAALAAILLAILARVFIATLSPWHAMLGIAIAGLSFALLAFYQSSALRGVAGFFCGQQAQSGCHIVQENDFLKPLGFSMAGAGIAFYSALLILLFWLGKPVLYYQWLLYIHLAVAVFVLGAWVYQWRVIKAFCILCFFIGLSVLGSTAFLWWLRPVHTNTAFIVPLLCAGGLGLLIAALLEALAATNTRAAQHLQRLQQSLFGQAALHSLQNQPPAPGAEQLPVHINLAPAFYTDEPAVHAILDLHCTHCKTAYGQLLHLANFTRVSFSFMYNQADVAVAAALQSLAGRPLPGNEALLQLEKTLFRSQPPGEPGMDMPVLDETATELFRFVQQQGGGHFPLLMVDNKVLPPAYTGEDLIYLLPTIRR